MYVVITGTSRGIGLALTRMALEKGGTVLAVARDTGAATELMKLKTQHRDKLLTVDADMTNPEAGDKIANAIGAWPQVDILINNAGVFARGEKAKDFSDSFQVNSVAPYLVTKALVSKLHKAPKAKVAHVTSLMGSIADNTSGGSVPYRASKAALNMINKCLAMDNTWLTTIVVHPGWVKTDMGGNGAPVEIDQSAEGIWKVIEGLKGSDTGGFFDFRGKTLPW